MVQVTQRFQTQFTFQYSDDASAIGHVHLTPFRLYYAHWAPIVWHTSLSMLDFGFCFLVLILYSDRQPNNH